LDLLHTDGIYIPFFPTYLDPFLRFSVSALYSPGFPCLLRLLLVHFGDLDISLMNDMSFLDSIVSQLACSRFVTKGPRVPPITSRASPPQFPSLTNGFLLPPLSEGTFLHHLLEELFFTVQKLIGQAPSLFLPPFRIPSGSFFGSTE